MTYAKISTTVVREACELYLENRKNRIEQIREKLIEKKMNGWIFKRTREQAIEALMNSDAFISAWERPEFEGSYWSSMVEEILRLANATKEETMNISPSDASLLGL